MSRYSKRTMREMVETTTPLELTEMSADELRRQQLAEEAEDIRLAQAGDSEALESLCSRHYNTVLSHARRHAVSEENAQDATQETFVRMVRKIKDFENRGEGLAPWLQVIVRNTIMSQFRHSKRHPAHSLDYDEGIYTHLADDKLNFEDEVIEYLDSEKILAEVANELSPERFEIMQALINGETSTEYAERQGIPRLTVGSRLSRGRKHLVANGFKELLHSQMYPN